MDVINDGIASATEQMERDVLLIANLHNLQQPLIRFYQWQNPTVTHGYFIQPEEHLHLPMADIELVQRPTGGGILFHWSDFSFTVAIPHSHSRFSNVVLENYHWINQAVLQTIIGIESHVSLVGKVDTNVERLNQFCMATATQYDILLDGRKIGGSAQRKTRYGYIHQSSIFLKPPPWDVVAGLLKNGEEVVGAMQKVSGSLLLNRSSEKEVIDIREHMQIQLQKQLVKDL